MPEDVISVYPQPKRWRLTGGRVCVPSPLTLSGPGTDCGVLRAEPVDAGWIQSAFDSSLATEAYRLRIAQSGVELWAGAEPGLRWALMTLRQLLEACELRELEIEDWPDFAHRGFMLDISRDRVPTMASLQELVEAMSACKLNHLQLYTEHAFAYRKHEAVWLAASPLTAQELSELGRYAAAHGIALAANQNCLGHMERWLRVPGYEHLGELRSPMAIPNRGVREPSTLIPGDRHALALVRELLTELASLCPSPRIHIGCDEPFDLGFGASADRVRQLGHKAVFSEHVGQVSAICQELGKRPMFWCDPEPNEDDSLPEGLIALVWEYEGHRGFRKRLQAHAACGREVWVCPGTSNWLTTGGRTWNRRANLARAASEGQAAGAVGYLVTEWGDRGHLQQWPMTLFGMAEGAQCAWNAGAEFASEQAADAIWQAPQVGSWLARLGDVDCALSNGSRGSGTRIHNMSALGLELHFAPLHAKPIDADVAAWETVQDQLAVLEATRPSGRLEAECQHAVRLGRWAATRALARRRGLDSAAVAELQQELAAVLSSHRELWLRRSRPGGLQDSCAWLRRHLGYEARELLQLFGS